RGGGGGVRGAAGFPDGLGQPAPDAGRLPGPPAPRHGIRLAGAAHLGRHRGHPVESPRTTGDGEMTIDETTAGEPATGEATAGWTTLVDAAGLAASLDAPGLRIVHARFALNDPAAGRQAYRASHLPGAVHADLDRDL